MIWLYLHGVITTALCVGIAAMSRVGYLHRAKRNIIPPDLNADQSPEWRKAYQAALTDLDDEFPAAIAPERVRAAELATKYHSSSLHGSFNDLFSPALNQSFFNTQFQALQSTALGNGIQQQQWQAQAMLQGQRQQQGMLQSLIGESILSQPRVVWDANTQSYIEVKFGDKDS